MSLNIAIMLYLKTFICPEINIVCGLALTIVCGIWLIKVSGTKNNRSIYINTKEDNE